MQATVKNVTVFAREWGSPGQGDAFLFLHGIESHSGWFAPVAARLESQGLWTMAYDRPGWGQSAGKRGHVADVDTTLEEALRHVRLLKERGAKRVHVIGQSWGAMVAIALAELAPNELFRITLISPGLYPSVGRSLGIAARAVRGVLTSGYHKAAIDLGLAPETFSPNLESQSWIRADAFRVSDISCQTIVTTLRFKERCSSLIPPGPFTVPTQVLIGSLDVMIDRARTIRFANGKGCQVEDVPNAGHALVLDAPQFTADALLRFHGKNV